jgi:hypothetical protein
MEPRNRIVRTIAISLCAALCVAAGVFALRAQDDEGLRVTGSGVGTGVVDRELQGRAEEFPEQTEVWFWTRIEGGEEGDYIVHVWLREGVEVYRHELRVGGSHWRTWSSKMLHSGSEGEWIVEARDEEGLVLARDTFRCTPAE